MAQHAVTVKSSLLQAVRNLLVILQTVIGRAYLTFLPGEGFRDLTFGDSSVRAFLESSLDSVA